MAKSRFNTEQEANEYKRKHQLHQQVAVSIQGTSKWALIFPIESHVTVHDGVSAELRALQGSCRIHLD